MRLRIIYLVVICLVFTLILTSLVALGKDIEITFWHIFSPESTRGKALNQLIENFNNQSFTVDGNRIVVKGIYKGGNGKLNNPYNVLFSELLKSISENKTPNVTIAYENWISQFKEIEVIKDFDSNPIFYEYVNSLYPQFRKACFIDNKIYSLSFNKSFFVLYYNPKYVDKLPTNLDDFIAKLKDIKNTTNLTPLYLEPNEDTFITFYLLLTNDDFFDIKDHIYPKFTEKINEVTKLIKNLENEGLIKWTTNSIKEFNEQKAPIILSTTSKYIDFKNKGFSIAPLPADNGRIYSAGTNLIIFKDDPIKEKASEKFVEFLINKNNLEYFCINTGYIVPTENYSSEYSLFLSNNPQYKYVIEYSKNKLYVQQPIWAWENIRHFISDYMFSIFYNNEPLAIKQKELKDKVEQITLNQNINLKK